MACVDYCIGVQVIALVEFLLDVAGLCRVDHHLVEVDDGVECSPTSYYMSPEVSGFGRKDVHKQQATAWAPNLIRRDAQ